VAGWGRDGSKGQAGEEDFGQGEGFFLIQNRRRWAAVGCLPCRAVSLRDRVGPTDRPRRARAWWWCAVRREADWFREGFDLAFPFLGSATCVTRRRGTCTTTWTHSFTL
jgi:hypothetical protein